MFRRAAAADEDPSLNFVRAHALEAAASATASDGDGDVAGDVAGDGATVTAAAVDDAAARIFSNPPESYGSGVADRVQDGSWEAGSELTDTFVARNAYAWGRGVRGAPARSALDALLRTTEAVVQQVDSVEYGLTGTSCRRAGVGVCVCWGGGGEARHCWGGREWRERDAPNVVRASACRLLRGGATGAGANCRAVSLPTVHPRCGFFCLPPGPCPPASTDIQEYHANTGALVNAARAAKGTPTAAAAVTASIVEAVGAPVTAAGGRVTNRALTPLDDLLRTEYRAKLLNPAWAEAMLAAGSGGAYEVSTRATALVGWGGAVGFGDSFVYEQVRLRWGGVGRGGGGGHWVRPRSEWRAWRCFEECGGGESAAALSTQRGP